MLISPPWPSTFGQPLDRAAERLPELGHGDAGAREQRRRAAVLLREQRGEQMLRLDEAVVVAERHALRVGERLLEFGGELVEAHCYPLETLHGRWGPGKPIQAPAPPPSPWESGFPPRSVRSLRPPARRAGPGRQ